VIPDVLVELLHAARLDLDVPDGPAGALGAARVRLVVARGVDVQGGPDLADVAVPPLAHELGRGQHDDQRDDGRAGPGLHDGGARRGGGGELLGETQHGRLAVPHGGQAFELGPAELRGRADAHVRGKARGVVFDTSEHGEVSCLDVAEAGGAGGPGAARLAAGGGASHDLASLFFLGSIWGGAWRSLPRVACSMFVPASARWPSIVRSFSAVRRSASMMSTVSLAASGGRLSWRSTSSFCGALMPRTSVIRSRMPRTTFAAGSFGGIGWRSASRPLPRARGSQAPSMSSRRPT